MGMSSRCDEAEPGEGGSGAAGELWSLYGREMTLHWVMCLPAVLILILSVLRVNVKKAMSVSILAAVVLCIFLRHLDAVTILKTAILGYTASDAEVGAMLNGGGIISMVRVALIVMISSAYSGIFRKTGLLDGLCGKPIGLDQTDGLRITLKGDEIVHFRPSGNAPELRCYAEAATPARAAQLVRISEVLKLGKRKALALLSQD